MKIIQIPANADYGGLPLHVLTLARGLRERGHQVEILSMSDGPMIKKFETDGFPVAIAPALGRKINANPLTWLRAGRFVRDTVAQRHPDLVHSHGPRAHLFAGLALRGNSFVPLVSTAHGSFTQFVLGHEQEFGGIHKRLRRLKYNSMDRLTGHLADRFIAVSEATGRDLIEHAGIPASKVKIVYNGIEEQNFAEQQLQELRQQLGCRPDSRLVVFVGRLAYHKGAGLFADAAAAVAQRLPDTRFVMVGEGPMEAELQRRSGATPLAERLIIAGRRADAVAIIAAADLFALPSLSEGLPLTLLEAAMCGRAVVASNTGGIPEIVRNGETGLLAPPGEARVLADIMEKLLANEEERETMGAAARQLWERRFRAEKMVKRVEELYIHTINSPI